MANNYKQYKKAKKEKNLAERGQVAGGTLAGVGAGMLVGRGVVKNLEKKTLEEAARKGAIIPKELIEKGKVLNKAKGVGAGLILGGGALAGWSTVKQQRAKRKLKELIQDDNNKKKD